MEPKGTIYFRDNAWYKMENVIKMGIASFAKDRSSTYITGEVERGHYVCVIEIPLDKMRVIDKCLKNYFKEYNIYKGGGELTIKGTNGIANNVTRYCRITVAKPPYPKENPAA